MSPTISVRLLDVKATQTCNWAPHLATLGEGEVLALLRTAVASNPGWVTFDAPIKDLPLSDAQRLEHGRQSRDAFITTEMRVASAELLTWAAGHLSATENANVRVHLATRRIGGYRLLLAEHVGWPDIPTFHTYRHNGIVEFQISTPAGPLTLRALLAEEFNPAELATFYAAHGQAGLTLLVEMNKTHGPTLLDQLHAADASLT